MSIKILVHSSPKQAERYAELLRQHGFTVATSTNEEEARKQLPETEVIFCWRFPVHLLTAPEAASLKWIQTMSAGVDQLVHHVPSQILLTRVVDQFGGPISEYVFSYILYLTKDIPRLLRAQGERKWEPFLPEFLSDKTIGVAGLGSIGQEIVRKARAFDMTVYGLSFSGKQAHLVDRHFGPNEWKAFVKELDYLVLILPLTSQTCHVIDREILYAMKPGATLINVGRGKLIKEDDLIEVMRSGHLKAAVLDVFAQEPLPSDHPFWTLPNVFVTPHMSGPGRPEHIARYFAENLKRYLEGKPLIGVVDRKAEY